ncbi:30S ribosome-binding factor RbfA [Helicobacter didelphidarum]|uniref:30S ribosome-binding factor RbfA n=1 Tax=Helicobacter didelphidarum TaxID=2040648 RepID=A0A3D8IQ90_9HELI|nr:30S ribosome-binding factor RbfA [Helicobacter didelphidarum]RDU67085.1 30S ribosome-binding factor RbfA [Helicobacter didelphidarum]
MQNRIIQERRESFLREILSEALGNLQDSRLNNLQVTRVECSKGKYDAKVFIEKGDLSLQEQEQIIRAFKKAKSIIGEYIVNVSGWHTAPKLSLRFDRELEMQNRLDKIFMQINDTTNNK